MTGPLVTVITATFNCSHVLRFALASVLRQDLQNFEVWVIGDACTDDSEAVVRAMGDPRLHWHNRARNSGSQGGPNNEGLERARGRYIAYLGHDDLWFPWHLSRLVRRLEAHDAALVNSLCALIAPEGAREAAGPPSVGRTYASHHAPPSSWLHRADLVTTCGPWKEHHEIAVGVDVEYLARIHEHGLLIAFDPQLSVLKFPSAWWRPYAREGPLPQEKALHRMQDATALQSEILHQLAVLLARQRAALPPVTASLATALRVARTRLLDGVARKRGPLAGVYHHYYQAVLRRNRRIRGL